MTESADATALSLQFNLVRGGTGGCRHLPALGL